MSATNTETQSAAPADPWCRHRLTCGVDLFGGDGDEHLSPGFDRQASLPYLGLVVRRMDQHLGNENRTCILETCVRAESGGRTLAGVGKICLIY